MPFEEEKDNDEKEQSLDLPQAVSKKALIAFLTDCFPGFEKSQIELQLSACVWRYWTVVGIKGDRVTVFGAQNNKARPAPEFSDYMFELACSEEEWKNICQEKEEQKIAEREESAKKIKELLPSLEEKECFTFDELVEELEQRLRIKKKDILHCFDKVLRCRKEGLWTLSFGPGNGHVIINRYDDNAHRPVEWELAVSEGKILDKERNEMVEVRNLVEMVGLSSKYFRDDPFSSKGTSPDVDDIDPGRHIADSDRDRDC